MDRKTVEHTVIKFIDCWIPIWRQQVAKVREKQIFLFSEKSGSSVSSLRNSKFYLTVRLSWNFILG